MNGKFGVILTAYFATGIFLLSQNSFGADEKPQPSAEGANTHVKYKAGKEVDFEELLIQGRLKRPEITVVTGDSGQGTDGLLKLRENFLDRMSVDMAEEVK